MNLLSELRGFEFVTTLVLVFRKIDSEDKRKNDTFYSKAEIIIMKLIMYFNQSALQLCQTYKNL